MKTTWFKGMTVIAAVVTFFGAGFAVAGQPSSSLIVPGAVSKTGVPQGPMANPFAPDGFAVKFAPARIIVKFKGGTFFPALGRDRSPADMAHQMTAVLPATAQGALAKIQAQAVKGFANIGVLVLSTPLGVGPAIEELYRSGTVEFAEPDYQVEVLKLPNDPEFSSLWGQNNTGQSGGTPDADMDLPKAWDSRTTAASVIVGVVDTGIDYTHEDLSANMWQNPGEIPGNGLDDDSNGYVDDVHGIDTFNNDSDPFDDNSHGTHVSGTIGASGNNGIGVNGIAWAAKLMALKFLSSDGWGSTSDAVELINYAINIKSANCYQRMILSNSWGGGAYSQALFDAIAAARDAGIIFVAAAGNSGLDTDSSPAYPAGYALDNIISVGASDRNDDAALFSNHGGNSVDLFAPGVSILSTVPDNGYASFSGTSMATPHVTGLAALVWAKYPTSPWTGIKSALLNGVDVKPSLRGMAVTQGRANGAKSLIATMQTLPAVWEIIPGMAVAGDIVTIRGRNFGAKPGQITLNGKVLPVISWSGSEVKAKIQTGTASGHGKVLVTTVDGNTSPVGGNLTLVSFMATAVGQTVLGHAWSASAKVGSDVWIVGGGTYWGQTGLVERYSLLTNHSVVASAWTMPQPVMSHGAAAIGTNIYVVGGFDSNTEEVHDTLQIFNTVTGVWSTGAPLPQPLYEPAVVALGDGRLYVFGGLNELRYPLNTTYIYDPASDSWVTGAPMPVGRSLAAAIRYGSTNRAWVLGGYSDTVFQYDAETGLWSVKPSMTTPRSGAAAAFFKNAPHILHGMGESGPLVSGERFTAGSWRDDIAGGGGLYTSMAATLGANLYILGGRSSTGYSSTVWKVTE